MSKIDFLVGNAQILNSMDSVPSLPMFSERVVIFLEKLSRELMNHPGIRQYVDVMSYAYWIRKASIEKEIKTHADYKSRIGRGVAFHIAPSNVPVNFAVSMTSSILAGNASIIRVSNRLFEQVDIICMALNKLLSDEFMDLQNYLCIIRYDHDDIISSELSLMCDIRIIWGGDNTINSIRKLPVRPRSIEMAFADRHSIAIIDSDYYMTQEAHRIAKDFYTDTFYTDQNACSSPRLVVWLGNRVDEARKSFWEELGEIVASEYDIKPIQVMDKYSSFCRVAMVRDDISLISHDNYITRIEVESLFPELMEYKNGSGYFFEYIANELEDIIPILNIRCQTVSVLGVDKRDIKNLVFKYGTRGVDRIVNVGQTMGLEFVWDGYHMIENMTRLVYLYE